MRSIGYSFKSAIADLVDNSVSASSTKIEIILETSGEPYLIIFDNGSGMDEKELEEAMRYGSTNPLAERSEEDLGRFGLGLKSASLSQCRVLTVVSKKGSDLSCRSWNLDHVIKKGKWSLLGYDTTEIEAFPKIELLDSVKTGTYVLLQKFDRISASTSNLPGTLKKYAVETSDHLALVFHRYIDEGVSLTINGDDVGIRDPFLKKNKATQHLREQSFVVNGAKITVNPYILPHLSKLTKQDISLVGSKEELRKDQGFYIYRNKRLIIWGTWFRLGSKQELSKLARVMVDIPNSLDYMWSIDIKKSSANLPDLIKKNLYASVAETVFSSEKVHQYRGRKEHIETDFSVVWERLKTRDGFKYTINRTLPQFQILESMLDTNELRLLEKLVETLEESFPVQAIYLDAAQGLIDEPEDANIQIMTQDIMEQLDFAFEHGMNVNTLYQGFINVEPYCRYPQIGAIMEKEMKKYE